MTSSAQDMDQLDPNDLPEVPTSLDVWLLRDQAVLLTANLRPDKNKIFTNFVTNK